jgi:hypothetical protein
MPRHTTFPRVSVNDIMRLRAGHYAPPSIYPRLSVVAFCACAPGIMPTIRPMKAPHLMALCACAPGFCALPISSKALSLCDMNALTRRAICPFTYCLRNNRCPTKVVFVRRFAKHQQLMVHPLASMGNLFTTRTISIYAESNTSNPSSENLADCSGRSCLKGLRNEHHYS